MTNKPDLDAAKELLALVKTLARKNQVTFMAELGQSFSRHEGILKEKSIDGFGIHSGITAERRMKLIENFIATHY